PPDQHRRARDRAHRAYPHPAADELPGASAVPRRRARPDAGRTMSGGAVPQRAAEQADQSQTCCTASCLTPLQTDGSPARDPRSEMRKRSASCMIRARDSGREQRLDIDMLSMKRGKESKYVLKYPTVLLIAEPI